MLNVIDLTKDYVDLTSSIKSLEFQIASLRVQNIKYIKIIHGFGSSSSKSGQLRSKVHKILRDYQTEGKLTLFIKGENFSAFDLQTQYFIDLCSDAGNDEDYNKTNKAVSFIAL